MAILSQKSYLGELTDRLYRILQLDGPIEGRADGTILPVVVVGDATQPGFGSQRGRRFAGSFISPGGVGDCNLAVRADSDCIIEAFSWSSQTTGVPVFAEFFYGAPGEAPPYAVATTNRAQFLDRASVATEPAPFTCGFFDGVATPAGIIFCRGGNQLRGFPNIMSFVPFFMRAGSTIYFRSQTAAQTCFVNWSGRTFG